MAGYSQEFLQSACNEFHANGQDIKALAKWLGRADRTTRDIIKRFKEMGLTPSTKARQSAPFEENPLSAVVESLRTELEEARKTIAGATRPKFSVRTDSNPRSDKIRLVAIGDAHDSPSIPDKSRFEWMGAYVNEIKPDVVVQIGDFATLDSLNGHVPNETFQGKSKPSYMADMESFNLALDAMQIDDGIERHCTLGNHERRLYLFEDKAPEAYGMMQFELDRIFARHKWTYSPYGQIQYYGGVGFTHAALNRLGKTYGGKNAENTICNDAIHDMVVGHSHVERMIRQPKIGTNNYVQVLNLGCALPDGHVEDYAKHALTGWTWGIYDITIQHGHIQDRTWVSMAQLGERYG